VRALSLCFAFVIALISAGVGAKNAVAKEEKAFWYKAKSFSASRNSKELPLGTVLLVEWNGKKTIVIVERQTGKFMLSEPAAEMLNMKELGHAEVKYSVIARPSEKMSTVRGLSLAQVDSILGGDDVADVVSGVVAVADSAERKEADSSDRPQESETKNKGETETKEPPQVVLPDRSPEPKKVRKKEKFPLLAEGAQKDDSWRNNDEQVFAGINFAARVAGAAYGFSADEVKLVEEMLKRVCGIESKCNPTFIHHTPSGALSRYQGIGQLGSSETRRAHRTLKEIAEKLSSGVLRNTLEARSEHFDRIISRGFSASRFAHDPRFDPLYGSLMLMAIHAHTAEGKNLIRAILRTFLAVKDGEPVMYAITEDGIVIDPNGTITPTQLHIGVLQSAQLNPVGIVNDDGLVALNAAWSLNRVQNDANALLLRCWIVKPGEGSSSTGVVCPNSDYPRTKKEAIARIITNSAAKYYVSRSARDDSFRKKHLGRFAGIADIYLSSAYAHERDADDPTARRFYHLAQEAVSRIGWNVRAILFDDGYNVYVRSEKAKTFRKHLAAFRETHYLDEGTLKEQIKLAESMRALVREQIEMSPVP